MSKIETKKPAVTALSRGLAILRCFDRRRAELTVSEIARRTGLSQPTAWRLCQTLLDGGYLVRTPQAALRVGAAALTLGFAAIQGLGFPEVALPYLREIAERVGVTTSLSLKQGDDIVSIEACDGALATPNQPVGWRAPLFAVSSGLAVLARMSEQEREAAAQAWARTHSDATARARMATAVGQFRDQGYVRFDGMVEGQFSAVAVPLWQPGPDGGSYWAISCGGVRTQLSEDRLAKASEALTRVVPILEPALAAVPLPQAA